jgi:GNAT superfamily N-acetyltransferase
MIKVCEYRGEAEEAARFSIHCWRTAYDKVTFYPVWTVNYMRWQLFEPPVPERIHLLGAYLKNRLVGFFAAEEMTFRMSAGSRLGTMSSWLSIDPAHAREGVGAALQRAMWEWQASRGAAFMIGYVAAPRMRQRGRTFWTARIPGASLHARPAFWGHIFDTAAVAAAEFSAWEALGARLLKYMQRPPIAEDSASVRNYSKDDLAACCAIFQAAEAAAEFGYIWDDARRAHQLSFPGLAHTLVLDRGQGVEAFVNYSTLELVGRAPVRCAIIDFVAHRPGSAEPFVAFVRACAGWLGQEGHDLALILGPPVHSGVTLLQAGFLPLPPMQSLIFLPVDPAARMPRARRMHLHWR